MLNVRRKANRMGRLLRPTPLREKACRKVILPMECGKFSGCRTRFDLLAESYVSPYDSRSGTTSKVTEISAVGLRVAATLQYLEFESSTACFTEPSERFGPFTTW